MLPIRTYTHKSMEKIIKHLLEKMLEHHPSTESQKPIP